MKKKSRIESHYLLPRMNWENEHVSWAIEDWRKVIWSDECFLNLDGLDGMQNYWQDRRLPMKIFSKRHSGGGSMMAWVCFSGAGVGQLCELTCRLKYEKYVQILEEYMLPHSYAHLGTDFYSFDFQQEGASTHRAHATISWLNIFEMQRMEWAAVSSDINPIENVWGVMAQDVYQYGRRQLMTEQALHECIHQTWKIFSGNYLNELNKSMRDRCLELLRKN